MRESKLDFRGARKSKGLTQAEVAERAGIPQQRVSAIESGAVDPRVSTASAIAGALGMSLRLTDDGGDR